MSYEEERCVQANGKLFLLEHQSRLPGGADLYKKPAVESNPPCGFPGKDKQYGQNKKYGVDTGRTRHHEVPIHEAADEG